MMMFDSITMADHNIAGEILESLGQVTNLTSLDLSESQLSGEMHVNLLMFTHCRPRSFAYPVYA